MGSTVDEGWAEAELAPAWTTWMAALVPFAAYTLTASAHAYWLDSGEFVAAAVYLDIAHPPGHPLASLWGKLFALLPIGSIPLRVALSQATAGALALAATHRALLRSVVFCGASRGVWAGLLALGATWLIGGAYGYWFNAARPEVYALEAMLVSFALERMIALATEPDARDPRPFYMATLALGIGLANHHLIAVLAMPALLPSLVRLWRAHGARVLGTGICCGALGLFGYAYLPLRARTLPPMDLGHPVSLSSLAWVVSAKVYGRGAGTGSIEPLGDRFADLLVLLVETVSGTLLLIALLGLYVLARRRATRELAYVWGATAIVCLGARPILGGHLRGNPDTFGYITPGVVALVALAACAVSVIAHELRDPMARRAGALAGMAAVIAGVAQLAGHVQTASLASFHATDDFDEPRRRRVPEHALLVLTMPDTVFRYWGGESAEALRPDVTMIPVPFLDYGGTGEVLAHKHPELRPLIEGYLARSELSYDALRALADTRPVLVEADTRVTLPWLSRLVPRGLFHAVVPASVSLRERTEAALEREAAYRSLYAALGEQRNEPETKKKLLWMSYVDALQYALAGQNDDALRSAERGLALAPAVEQLTRLRAALTAAQGRPIDVRPYLVGP